MGAQYGLPCRPLPSLKNEVQVLDGDTIAVGNLSFNVLFTPGHAYGGLVHPNSRMHHKIKRFKAL